MDIALVENAEHDVDDEDRRGDQQRHRRQRGLERLRGSLERGIERRRHVQSVGHRLDGVDRLAERDPGVRLNDSVTAGKMP